MFRVYRYRIYPTKAQGVTLRWTLDRLRELYNSALQERRDAWRTRGVSIFAGEQMKALPEIKSLRPEYAKIYAQVLQDVIKRVDKTFKAFFRRVKSGEKPGYPRFKGRWRYTSFTYPQVGIGGAKLICGGKRLRLAGIGDVKIKLHRPIEGRSKTATVSMSGDGHWYICFACDDVPAKPMASTGLGVGVDVGINTFAALSDGSMVENPRAHEREQRATATAQRRIARRKRGSNRRRKAVALLAKRHDRIRRVRLDFHHKVAMDLVRRFDAIMVERLNIRGLARGRLAKQVLDAGWAQFTSILASKAECAGREFMAVDPRGTSQECSGCGNVVSKDLGVRVHYCPRCGLVEDRDVNAAVNIYRRGQRLRGGLSSKQPDEPISLLRAQ